MICSTTLTTFTVYYSNDLQYDTNNVYYTTQKICSSTLITFMVNYQYDLQYNTKTFMVYY